MEIDAIVEMFACSESLHKVKYYFYIGERNFQGN